jgi:hypothetical protein
MAAVLKTDDLRDSRGTHGPVVGPRVAGGMVPTSSRKLLDRLREALRSRYYRRHTGNRYGVPNGTKLRELWLRMRFLCQRNHRDFPSNEGLAGTRKRSITLNLVPLYGVPGIPTCGRDTTAAERKRRTAAGSSDSSTSTTSGLCKSFWAIATSRRR